MIEYTAPPKKIAFDGITAETIGIQFSGDGLFRTIRQSALWGTDGNPRMIPLEKVSIPQWLHFSWQETSEAMVAHTRQMVKLAELVQSRQASLPPCLGFFDGKQLWIASHFSNLFAAQKASPHLSIPVIVFEGDQSDAIRYAVDNGHATPKAKGVAK